MPLFKPRFPTFFVRKNSAVKALLYFLTVIPCCVLAQSFAPDPDWRFENFNSQNHFISKDVQNLTVDKSGYVWACDVGIGRFDGFRTAQYNSFTGGNGSLKNNYTADIVVDQFDKTWISSGGLCYYDALNDKFNYVQPDAKHLITFAFGFALQKNYLWFVCDYGLAKIDVKTLKITFTSITHITDPLESYVDDDTTLWVTSREKLYKYNIRQNKYTVNTHVYKHSLLRVYTIKKGNDGYFLSTNQGLMTLRNNNSDPEPIRGVENFTINDLQFLPRDKEKKYLFIATDGKGLLVYNTFLKKIEFTYTHDDNNPYSLQSNIINKIFVDQKGSIWFGTATGISMIDIKNQLFKSRYINKSNTDNIGIYRILKDKYDSTKVWMLCDNLGMVRIDWKTKLIEKSYRSEFINKKIKDGVQIDKTKWILLYNNEIIEWDTRYGIEQTLNKFPLPDSVALSINFRRIIRENDDGFFITANRGLFKYTLSKHDLSLAAVRKDFSYDLTYDLVNGFYENGTVWIASRNGLFKYDLSDKKAIVYAGKVKADYFLFDITRAAKDQIACAAYNGLALFDEKKGAFKIIHSFAKINNPTCLAVACTKRTVWVATDAGVLNYDLTTGITGRIADEMPFLEISPTSPMVQIDSGLVFGLKNEYVYFSPAVKKIRSPSDPVIENVRINNQAVAIPDSQKHKKDNLIFDHDHNSVNIAFTAFLYTDASQIKFRYLLKGSGQGWQNTAEQRAANFAQLAPGDYTFYVQSGNKNGIWNNHLASFDFVIQPPYWETWWFRTAIGLTVLSILYGLYRNRINNILAIQKIRERIASDFHDDIGSALSSISIFSEVVDSQLEEKLPHEQTREVVSHISFYSRNMLEAMDDIIWAVNPRNDHFNDLAVRMREFAIPLLEARNIRFDIAIEEGVLNTRVKMEARKNIFLIFKECINNIHKHSGSTAMKLSAKRSNNQLELIISDNGKGFDLNAPSSRNGLKNMQKRAGEINGTIQVTTQPGKGTVTRLTVNTV